MNKAAITYIEVKHEQYWNNMNIKTTQDLCKKETRTTFRETKLRTPEIVNVTELRIQEFCNYDFSTENINCSCKQARK